MLPCDNPFVNYVASKAVDNGMTFIESNLHYIKVHALVRGPTGHK